MIRFNIVKDALLPALLMVSGAIDKKQSGAILANILMCLNTDKIRLTATDLEIEISADIPCETGVSQEKITVPAKKFIDIIRSLDNVDSLIEVKDHVITIKAGRSQFKVATLPADDFPLNAQEEIQTEISLLKTDILSLLHLTHFAMAHQDVRFYLNGLLLEFDTHTLTAVAADGHRMAVCKLSCDLDLPHQRYLLPRKGVTEMLRLLNMVEDETILLCAGKNHIALKTRDYQFTTKLIEAQFPLYNKAIPTDNDRLVMVDNHTLKRSLSRIIILANEKSKAVLMHIEKNELTLIANNQEQEEAVESLEATVDGEDIKVGINANYLLDVLNVLPEGPIKLSLSSPNRSILVASDMNPDYQYIIMPMTL